MPYSIHMYTITINDKEYAADCPHYQWRKVEEFFGVPREQIRRGCRSRTPVWTPDLRPEPDGGSLTPWQPKTADGRLQLIPALGAWQSGNLRRMAGYWCFWRALAYTGNADGRREERIHCGKVARKRGDTLHMECHSKAPLHAAWLLDGDVDVAGQWPRYEWGSYRNLTSEEARAVFDVLGVALPEPEKETE